MAAKAYSKDAQRDACLSALDSAEASLANADGQKSELIYFYGPAAHNLNCVQCYLKLSDTDLAIDYAQQSYASLGPSFTRLVAFASVNLARAYVQSNDVDEAARLFGDAGEIAAHNSSARLIEVLKQGRAYLRPWQHTVAVRALDDRLTSQGLVLT